ncbi:alpha/beta hydrolase [Paraburkholderia sp. DHOC27]|uniref:alpha/beta hydrolase n=1 Tax=Paraburkholderia sp. DHOC27 TaxID=2303330 RepID=UPI000E3D78F5|nr:alpha/beta hydrolase [Paraburkholderia sp. DHOC27]RFU46841.1 alpha/beta hydrolase [Paraburkholderia sp. DHOC27]
MTRRLVTLSAAFALTALGGCSGSALLNAAVPHHTFRASTGIPYGPDPRQKVDVYEPDDRLTSTLPAAPHGRPIVVFFYGGSWQNGERGQYLFVGEALASRGFVAVVPDYRTWPKVGFPGFIEDAAAAVRWARDHATEFGGDPSTIFLMGHSAGAHIAVLLATDGHYLAGQHMSKRDLSGVIGLAGPYDFLPLTDPVLKEIFPLSVRAESQPINFVTGDEPPMFLAAGKRDTTVDPGNTDRLAAKMRAVGDSVEVKHYPYVGHVLLVASLAAPLRFFAPALKDATQFISAEMAQKTARAIAPAPAAVRVDNVYPLHPAQTDGLLRRAE